MPVSLSLSSRQQQQFLNWLHKQPANRLSLFVASGLALSYLFYRIWTRGPLPTQVEAGKAKGQRKKKVMYILRGVPGSGKSTLAQSIIRSEGGVIYSTDDFFMKDGVYVFDGKAISNAHQWNQQRTETALQQGVSPLIIDNTNTQKWEAKFYVEKALEYGYDIVIREPDTPWWRQRDVAKMGELNKHNVNADVIKKMIERWESDFTVENILKAELPKFAQTQSSSKKGSNNNNNNNSKVVQQPQKSQPTNIATATTTSTSSSQHQQQSPASPSSSSSGYSEEEEKKKKSKFNIFKKKEKDGSAKPEKNGK